MATAPAAEPSRSRARRCTLDVGSASPHTDIDALALAPGAGPHLDGCHDRWVRFSELARVVRERPGPVRLVAVDGPGGAGKSTFASALSTALGRAPIVHTDEFASADDPIDWWPRLRDQVIEPLAAGRSARYQRYDWSTESLADWIDLDPTPVVIVEGVTAARTEWRHHLAFIIWIETPRAERLRRGLERDGHDAVDDWTTWGEAEDRHYEADPTRQHADIVVDGTIPVDDGSFATVETLS